MISPRMIPREEVARRLGAYGVRRVGALDENNDSYGTPTGDLFIVPAIGDEGMCAEYVVQRILNDLPRPH